jgi:hypothetical protein
MTLSNRIEPRQEVEYSYKLDTKYGFDFKYVIGRDTNQGYKITSVTGDPSNIFVAVN